MGAISGYLTAPAEGKPRPGVVVIHEAYGLNDNIRNIAERFAAAGYRALAVDLFSHGRNRPLCMVRVLTGMLRNPLHSFSLVDLDNAVAFLRARPDVDAERMGVIGFCMGGTFALALAVHNTQIHASSAFYGANPKPLSQVARACPIVASYGADDRFFAPQGARLAEALDDYAVPHDVKVYPGAGHSFFNDARGSYRPEAAADAWQRTLRFFATHLHLEPPP